MGANIPGKKREQLNYLGGIAQYDKECRAVLETLGLLGPLSSQQTAAPRIPLLGVWGRN
jgi:hypothetical protein